jgi:taurine dioxygenase
VAYRHISVELVSPTIGGEVGNVDLSRSLSPPIVNEIRQALLERGVLFFRDQDITPEQQLSFARNFGELESYPPAPGLYEGQPANPELLLLVADRDHLPAADHWHSDQSWALRPAMGSILRAVEVPEAGGDTLFADMYAAYDGLGAEIQSFICGLKAVNEFTKLYGHACEGLLKMDLDEMKAMLVRRPSVVQPVVRTHPETGRKALYVNHFFTRRILGMPEDASRHLLDFLCCRAEVPEYQCRFRWRKNSIAFWDNRRVQHYAVADYYPKKRIMHRITICGDEPY